MVGEYDCHHSLGHGNPAHGNAGAVSASANLVVFRYALASHALLLLAIGWAYVVWAGGTTDRAANKRVQIMRTDENGVRVSLTVNLKRIKQGKDEDPILQADDIVLVPEGFF